MLKKKNALNYLDHSLKKTNTLKGFTFLLVANTGWGISDVFIAYLSRGQFTTWFHGVTGAIFLYIVFLFTKEKFSFYEFRKTFWIGLQRSIVWTVLFFAFQEDNPAIAISILATSGIFAILAFSRFEGEKPTIEIYAYSIVAVIGVLLVSLKNLDQFSFTLSALLSIFILPISALGTTILQHVQKTVPANKSGFYMYLWIAILISFTLPFYNLSYKLTFKEFGIFVLLAIFGAGGHILYGISQNLTTFNMNIIASNIHVPLTAIFTFLILVVFCNCPRVF